MYLIISASPNTDGLTAACVAAAEAGFHAAGAESTHLNLCAMNVAHCRQCGNGWGQCSREHTCVVTDDLRAVQAALGEARGVVLISPVYYGELSESAKSMLDRLRRCESTAGEGSRLNGMPVIAVAAAGGSGGGISSCLAQMERYVQHMRGQVADLIGITQRDRAYTLDGIRAAATTLAQS